jgi:hypothetical protein
MKDNPKNNRKPKSSGDGPYWVYALYRDGVAIAQIGCGPCTRREAEKHVPGVVQETEFEFDPSTDRLEMVRRCMDVRAFLDELK